jgi:hypothetical protein
MCLHEACVEVMEHHGASIILRVSERIRIALCDKTHLSLT